MSMALHPSVRLEFENNNAQVKVIAVNEGYCRKGSGTKLRKSITGIPAQKLITW